MELHLYTQLTRKYRLGWSHLDESEYTGTVKMLTPRKLSDDGIDGHTSITRVIAPAALRSVDLTDAIEDTLTTSRCQHEHDCCGCATTHAYARRVSPREYSVFLSTYYNV
jgi:hypothetical protein